MSRPALSPFIDPDLVPLDRFVGCEPVHCAAWLDAKGESMISEHPLPDRPVRFCGANCSDCEAYRGFLVGDEDGPVNPESGYRCCWLPTSYPEGRDCPIRICCEERGFAFCGECAQFAECTRMAEFYAQPGYDRLRDRMLAEVARRTGRVEL